MSIFLFLGQQNNTIHHLIVGDRNRLPKSAPRRSDLNPIISSLRNLAKEAPSACVRANKKRKGVEESGEKSSHTSDKDHHDVEARIKTASMAFGALRGRFFGSRNVPGRLKSKIYAGGVRVVCLRC